MKSFEDFKSDALNEAEEKDRRNFDMLVRAGLANKAQLQRIHKILDKMSDERPQFNNSDRMILQNLFNKMVDLISNNKQIFNTTRRVVREEEEIEEEESFEDKLASCPLLDDAERKFATAILTSKEKTKLNYKEKQILAFSTMVQPTTQD